MDAADLVVRETVTVTKLIGSEGSVGGTRVKEAEGAVQDSDRQSTVARPLIDKDATSALTASGSANWNNSTKTELVRCTSQVHNSKSEDAPDQLKSGGSNVSLLFNSKGGSAQLLQNTGKVAKRKYCKRPRIAQTEELSSQGGNKGVSGISDMTESYLSNNAIPGGSNQKNNLNSKRRDKRNSKFPPKNKLDQLALKSGLASFTSAAGGNTILGLYGLKTGNHDAIKHMTELSLNELLDDQYESPTLSKDKAKIEANVNENFLHSIQNAFSILDIRRPVKSQNCMEIDSRVMSPSQLAPASCVASSSSSDKEDTNATELSVDIKPSIIQDFSNKSESPPKILDITLLHPKDIIDRLALPPRKDLESLLLNAANSKSASFSRNNSDIRSGRSTSTLTNKTYLPPFSWSHYSVSSLCKINSDSAAKSPSYSKVPTCHGKWIRIEKSPGLLGIVSDSFTDLNSLTYDKSLVPSWNLQSGTSENVSTPDRPETFIFPTGNAESERTLKHEIIADEPEHSPRLRAAAQTLVDMANHSSIPNPSGMTRWPYKPSQKSMKARKLKFIQKPENCIPLGKSKREKPILPPSKKAKLSFSEKKANADIKIQIHWSAPKSCRSSPNRSVIDSNANEVKHYKGSNVKQHCMLPPPLTTRVSEKACNNNSEQKARKLVSVGWNRGREGKMD